jgi:hypothetical protein
VSEEPQHYPRFENAFVRVYDVRFSSGEQSLIHRHLLDTFYVTVHAASVLDHTYGAPEGQILELPVQPLASFLLCMDGGIVSGRSTRHERRILLFMAYWGRTASR